MDWKKLIAESNSVLIKPDGTMEVSYYADYHDKLSKETLKDILQDEDPDRELREKVLDWFADQTTETVFEIIDNIKTKLDHEMTDQEEDELRDAIYAYVEFDYPFEHYLDQKICVNVVVDTGDGNYDFACNAEHVPHYDGNNEPYNEHTSILWLARQQGYTDSQLYERLNMETNPETKSFLGSLYQEIENCSTSMNALTFFISMPLHDLITLNEQAKKEPESKLIIKKDTDCGLYDGWSGAGGILDIQLDKDVELPLKYLFRGEAMPDGMTEYSVAKVFGICETLWKQNQYKFGW